MNIYRVIVRLIIISMMLSFAIKWEKNFSRDEKNIQETLSLKIPLDGIKKIFMKTRNKELVEIEKIQEDWIIVSPKKIKANKIVINTMLESLNLYKFKKLIKGKSQFNKFGLSLDSWTMKIVFESKIDKSPMLFYFGNDSVIGYKMYFSMGSDQVYIGSKHLKLLLNKSLFELREKNDLNDHDIDQISI